MFLQGHILISALELLVVTCFFLLVYCGFFKQTKQFFIILICWELLLGHDKKGQHGSLSPYQQCNCLSQTMDFSTSSLKEHNNATICTLSSSCENNKAA
jgi:hypothetical protein